MEAGRKPRMRRDSPAYSRHFMSLSNARTREDTVATACHFLWPSVPKGQPLSGKRTQAVASEALRGERSPRAMRFFMMQAALAAKEYSHEFFFRSHGA